jgi:cytochrome c oxidase assembly protein subunit 15
VSNSPRSFPEIAPARRTAVGVWLALWAAMVLLTVVIGGVTRLTESGLSITEWKPVTGIVPPRTDAAWAEAFRQYQEIPEYQQLNQGMSLAEFKRIFFWEYLHRLWARLVGAALAVPLAVFLLRGGLPGRLTRRLVGILVLTGAQGVLGWYMVRSGLSARTDVSQYRLAAHLGLALIIHVVTVWTAADLLVGGTAERRNGGTDVRWLRPAAVSLAVLVFMTAIAGAFVAGINGGLVFNTFPLMGGRVVPPGYALMDPWWKNPFENVAAVQFNHRVLGILSAAGAVFLWWFGRRAVVGRWSRAILLALPAVAAVQLALGVATLVLRVPVGLAALHQAGAVLLLTVAVLLVQAQGRNVRTGERADVRR